MGVRKGELGALVGATFAQPKHRVDVHTFDHPVGNTSELNEIEVWNVSFDHPIPFDQL